MFRIFKSNSFDSVKGIFFVFLILSFHVLFLAFVIASVFIFRGIINYFFLILTILGIFTFLVLFSLYRRIKLKKYVVNNINSNSENSSPLFELSFLGGLASFKFGGPLFLSYIKNREFIGNFNNSLFIPNFSKSSEITRLAGLLEKRLITVDEYNKAKEDIFKI